MQSSSADRPSLFRPEVAERTWEVLASRGLMPLAPRLTGWIIAGLVVVFVTGGILLWRGVVPRQEIAQGYLEPAGGVVRVRASRQAIVGAIHVRDGQMVKQGDLLVTLQSSQTTESGESAEAEIGAQLRGQHQDLEAQIARERDWRASEERRLKSMAGQLAQDIEMLDANIETQQKQAGLAQAQADRVRDLAGRGTISVDELQRREIAALGQRLAVQTSERELASKRAQLVQARIALEQLPTVASERQRSLRQALADVQQRLIEIDARRAVVVRAPVGGRIAAIPALAGAAVESGGLIATIVPEGSQLHARLFVPTRAIGKMHPGQLISIRYEAFPYQKYGTFKGRIQEVSSSVLMPQEIEKVSPVRVGEPAYVLDATIERQSVMVGEGREASLRPDMLFSATIEIDRRPILAWIGESVFGLSQH